MSGPFAEGGPAKRRTGYQSSQPCTNGRPRSCIVRLAEGWILTSDLCGPCTSRFMVALERIEGTDLAWHESYLERAEESTE